MITEASRPQRYSFSLSRVSEPPLDTDSECGFSHSHAHGQEERQPHLSIDTVISRKLRQTRLSATRGVRIKLNVGGTMFETTASLLLSEPDSMLARIVSSNVGADINARTGSVFIDRDPTYFRHILNYLRERHFRASLFTTHELAQLRCEARFYLLEPLVQCLDRALVALDLREQVLQPRPFELSAGAQVSLQETERVLKDFSRLEHPQGIDSGWRLRLMGVLYSLGSKEHLQSRPLWMRTDRWHELPVQRLDSMLRHEFTDAVLSVCRRRAEQGISDVRVFIVPGGGTDVPDFDSWEPMCGERLGINFANSADATIFRHMADERCGAVSMDEEFRVGLNEQYSWRRLLTRFVRNGTQMFERGVFSFSKNQLHCFAQRRHVVVHALRALGLSVACFDVQLFTSETRRVRGADYPALCFQIDLASTPAIRKPDRPAPFY